MSNIDVKLFDWMLKEHREFVISKFKAPFCKLLIWYATKLPEPTKENCLLPNTRILLDIRDKFFEYDETPNREAVMKAIWKIFLVEHEHDIFYRDRANFVLEEIVNSDWKPRSAGHPNVCWKEPEPYGGGSLIKDKKLMTYRRRMKNLEEQYAKSSTKIS